MFRLSAAATLALCASMITTSQFTCATGNGKALETASVITPAGAVVEATRTPFLRNDGQIPEQAVRYYARTASGAVFVTADRQIVYRVPIGAPGGKQASWAFRESFPERDDGTVLGIDPVALQTSIYRGNDPTTWKSSLQSFSAVDLGEPYPQTRVTLRMNGHRVEKLFHVAPGGDPDDIAVTIDGVESMAIDEQGRLALATGKGTLLMTAPIAYQVVNERHLPVDAAYALLDTHRYGFKLGDYDPDHEVVIDPMLASTYLGGYNPDATGNYDQDIIYSMVAANGDIYVAGVTQSPDFPIVLGYDDSYDDSLAPSNPDGFIARLSPDLSTLVASTYIGTGYFDRVTRIVADTDGTIIAIGQAGYGFPVTPGSYNWNGSTPTGGGFVARFSADLSTLLASAVVVPSDFPVGLALGNDGIYFSGTTRYSGFPTTPGAYKTTCCATGPFGNPASSGFAGQISSDLTSLQALTYTNGSNAPNVVVTSDGGVLVTEGFDASITGTITRFNAGLSALSAVLSYYPGSTSGSSRTYFNSVVAADGHVVVGGQTYMDDLPATADAFDTGCGVDGDCDGIGSQNVPRADGFVAIYSNDLSSTLALTYFGGSDHESIRAVSVMANGDILAAGETISTDLPVGGEGTDSGCGTDGACDPVTTGMYTNLTPDAFVARFSPALSSLGYASYLGGSGEDHALALISDSAGRVYVAGLTDSTDFPTSAGAHDETWNGGTADAFVSSFDTGATGVASEMIFDSGFEN